MSSRPLPHRSAGQAMSAVAERPSLAKLASAYLELTKPRIVLLILMTGVPALLMAARGWPGVRAFGVAMLGTALAAASGSTFNHYVDRDIDGLMRRTARRPLPARTLAPHQALGFAFLLAAMSWTVLTLWANLLAAWIAVASIFYYAVIYSVWLKRRTPQNIVIGGAAGASAPLIAWAVVTGRVETPAVLLASIVFFWTPPHFWSLSLYRRDDYERAGLPMLPVTHGEDETRRQIALYSLALPIVTLGLVPLGVAGLVFGVPAAVLNLLFVYFALRLRRSASTPHAVSLFRYSILYLFLIFVLLTIDAGARALRG